MLFHPTNLPYWIFLGLGIVLFLMVITSAGSDDDFDADGDLNGGDADGDFELGQVISWLGFGRVPLVLLLAIDLSLWGILGWALNVAVGEWLGNAPTGLMTGSIFFASLLAALALGRWLARPLGQILAPFGEDASSDRLIGCVGRVSSALIPSYQEGRIGQVNVIDPAKNLVSVHAALPEWATVIPRLGQSVLVIDRHAQTYLVIAKDSPDQDHWLATADRPSPSR